MTHTTTPASTAKPTGGRPSGEVRKALLQAALDLNMGDRAATLRELARAACVGQSAARIAVKNMRRDGVLSLVRERSVAYRNRPVGEYAPFCLLLGTQPVATQSPFNFGALTGVWS